MWTIFDGLLEQYVYIEAGPNYHEVGRLRAVKVDVLGIPHGIFDDVRRVSDETEAGPTWLGRCGDDVRVPSTAITHLCACATRWPGWSPPPRGC